MKYNLLNPLLGSGIEYTYILIFPISDKLKFLADNLQHGIKLKK